MVGLSLLWWFAACTPEEPVIELSADDPILEGELPTGQAPPPFEMNLEAGNFVEGGFGRLTVTGLPPGEDVRVVWSTLLGGGPCPKPLQRRCLSIAGPVKVSPTTLVSTDGSASFGMRVPRGSAGGTLAIQLGFVDADPMVSNPVIRPIAAAGTAIQGDVDSDLDGYTPDEGDCADFDATYHPGAADPTGDGLDWDCDDFDGSDADGDGCEDGVGCSPWCGDGRVGGAEACDDDNRDDGDGCSADCQVEPHTTCDDAEPSVCDVDACAASPCFAGVSCTDVDPPGTGFVCGACPTGYTGDGVSCTNLDACSPNPCFSGVSCVDLPPPSTSFTCGACPTGYAGNGLTCSDFNACASSPCFPGASCVDQPPPSMSATCGACPTGYTGDGVTCTDINGCSPNPCFAGVACTDVAAPGTGFTCGACPTGYSGNGVTCVDTNGCSPNPCASGVTCTDVAAPGTGFTCGACPTGTTGNGVTCTALGTCKAIKDAGLSTGDGIYQLDPDGPGGVAPYSAYCDMTTDGGGWTLVAAWTAGTATRTFNDLVVVGGTMSTYSSNTGTYPVYRTGSTHAFTQHLFKDTQPTWTSLYGSWLRFSAFSAGAVIGSGGFSAVKSNGAAATIYATESGWSANTPMSSLFSLMTNWGAGGPCGGANVCASPVCPQLNVSAYTCHWDWTYQKLLFAR